MKHTVKVKELEEFLCSHATVFASDSLTGKRLCVALRSAPGYKRYSVMVPGKQVESFIEKGDAVRYYNSI